MKNTFGTNFKITIFGESHGDMIGCVIDGLSAGIKLNENYIKHYLHMRKPKGTISTSRQEMDQIHYICGYFNGYTTGTPLTILIKNENTNSQDYEKTKSILRPSHADYSAYLKYHGFQDYRGGGHFSGRITAPLVVAGSIARQILETKGILIGSHLLQVKNYKDELLSEDEAILRTQLKTLNSDNFPVLDQQLKQEMISCIKQSASVGDSVGGMIETAIVNLPKGIGEPFFASIESVLSALLFSIPAVKGVSFGLGFDFAKYYGSEVNDEFHLQQGTIKTKTNNNGGINGGISNGMPIKLQCVIKPTASIYKPQNSVNIQTKENTQLQIQGRHDPAIVQRARVVVDSVVAIGLLDLLSQRYGYEWMRED
ncbi:MAG: chorismate synthase [Breznakia sp.]